MQYEGLSAPKPGDPASKSIHSAAWLRQLVRAATGRGQGTIPQYDPDGSIELLTPVVDSAKVAVPAFSVIGAVGAGYGSLSFEPTPYMQGTLGRSSLLFYTRHDCPVEASSVQGFPFLPGIPVRVRVHEEAATKDYYVPGISVGRQTGQTAARAGMPGLTLVSPPFTPDNTNYFAWVVLSIESNACVILDAPLAAAANSKNGYTKADATFCVWMIGDSDEYEYVETDTVDEVCNHSESTDYATDTFGIAKIKDDHFWFFGDCESMADRDD